MKLTKEIHRAKTDKIIYAASMAHVCTNETENEKGQYVYDCIWVPVEAYTEAATVEGLKKKLKEQIEEYDVSEAVDSFEIDGVSLWLDKETRTGLYLRFLSEKANGKTETTLWKDTASFALGIDDAIKMLGKLEVYASACYDATHKHLSEASKLTDVDAILAYDFTTGYPEKLTFSSAGAAGDAGGASAIQKPTQPSTTGTAKTE